MEPWTKVYIALWASLCAVAIVIASMNRRRLKILTRDYWRFLLLPWKLALFVVALVGIVVIAPYTGDPTWDHVDAAFMAILAFVTAPWAVGTIFRGLRGRARWYEVFPAVACWLFSASWSYDGYLLLRDGRYPETWLWNLIASSTLYLSAGLLWNLTWSREGGIRFGFMATGWPAIATEGTPWRLLFWIALFVVPVALVFLWFLATGQGWM